MKYGLVFGLVVFFFSVGVHAQVLQVDSISIDPAPVVPGQTFTLYAYVTNPSGVLVKNVQSVLQLGKDSTDTGFPFSIEPSDSLTRELGNVPAYSTVQVKYQVQVSPAALDGSYKIILFTLINGNPAGSLEQTIDVVSRKPVLSALQVSPTQVNAGESVTLSVTLKNTGSSKAYDILATLAEDRTVTSTGVVVERNIFPLGAASLFVGELGVGETTVVNIPILINPAVESKPYFVPLTLEYYDQNKSPLSNTSYIGLKVVASPELDAVYVESVPLLSPGKKSSVTIDLFNRGLGPAKFVTASVSSDVFSFDKVSTFIGTIESDDFDSLIFDVRVDSSISPGNYPIIVTVNAKNEFGDIITLTKGVSVPVYSASEAANGGSGDSFPLSLIIFLFFIAGVVWWFRFRKPASGNGKK